MTFLRVQLVSLLSLAALVIVPLGCTNRTPVRQNYTNFDPSSSPSQTLRYIANIRFQDMDTSVMQMSMVGSSLFLTGKPFGFMRVEVGARPESPSMTFNIKDNIDQFSPFPPLGFWDPKEEASGALAVIGPFALLSGTFATSLVNISETSVPVEKRRFPMPDSKGKQGADTAYIYSAMVSHPTLPIVYGFRQQDYMYKIGVSSSSPYLSLVSKSPYSANGNVCCVVGGTSFMGKAALAMNSKLWFFDMGSDGNLSNWVETSLLQASAIASSPDHLYVYHNPVYNNSSAGQYPRGIYSINSAGTADGYFPIQNLKVFAVSPDNNYIYTNEDDLSIKIYQLVWSTSTATH